eukprot:GFUD01063360.1.p1 GENE.GFUD01063360.1~~GFUD01063360.1.p1  ORF type:complete len:595 (+),score=199.26 GFUD01063360.1:29-1813(+)
MEKMHFKLFLKLEHKEEEVRRCSCGESIEYEEFRCLVRNSFNTLPGDDFVLKWEDEDGDKVAISSDDEFKFAITHLKVAGDILRVDVEIFENPWWKQVQRMNRRTWANCTGEEHPGIFCSCCQQQVRGFRYKCLSCTSFDICGACEDKGMHPKHDMIRISSLRGFPPGLFDEIMSLYGSTETSVEENHKSEEHEENVDNIVTSKETEEHEENVTKIVKSKETEELMSLNISSKNQVPEFANEEQTCYDLNGKSSSEVEESNKDMDDTDHMSNVVEVDKTASEIEESDDDMEETFIEDKSNNNGKYFVLDNKFCREDSTNNDNTNDTELVNEDENLSKSEEVFKDSFVEVAAEDKKVTGLTKEEVESFETNETEKKDEMNASNDSFKNIQEEIESLLAPMTPLPDLESVNNVMKINKGNDMDTNKEICSASGPSLVESDEKNDKEDIADEKKRQTLSCDKKIKDRENSVIASITYSGRTTIHSCLEDSLRKLEDSMKSTSTKIEEYSENDTDGQSATNNELTGSSSKSVDSAPYSSKLPEIPPTPKRHYNSRIANALDQMTAMGFSDNDGWLTELLIRKHGDISQVLEILSPVKK